MTWTRIDRLPLSAGTLLCVALLICGCSEKNGKPVETILIDGSSTVYPITEAIDKEFEKTGKNIRLSVGISGTTGGLRKFSTGEIDIANASRPIKKTEAAQCADNGIEFIELPVAFDGLAVVVHPANTWCDHLTVSELRRLWESKAQGTIMKWSNIRKGWPDQTVHLFGAGYESGTYDYFTAAIVGTEHSSREDFTRSEDDNILVRGIAADRYALGFFGLGYYEGNRDILKLLAIDDEIDANGKGPVLPNVRTVSDGTYQPLSRPVFIYVNKSSLGKKPGVREYVHFYLTHARKFVREAGYIPLSVNAYSIAINRLDRRVTGSVFKDGLKIGVSIEEILK
ncbi:MAG: PstS family phosphate ABC transporter substrate-binding protein [Chitinispirillaceae bacterium]|nr:PstS family phosphate ABC transporter substrate-binding protein [Chitinispirillaceae bacterium]